MPHFYAPAWTQSQSQKKVKFKEKNSKTIGELFQASVGKPRDAIYYRNHGPLIFSLEGQEYWWADRDDRL